jgi:hypothetical protein
MGMAAIDCEPKRKAAQNRRFHRIAKKAGSPWAASLYSISIGNLQVI